MEFAAVPSWESTGFRFFFYVVSCCRVAGTAEYVCNEGITSAAGSVRRRRRLVARVRSWKPHRNRISHDGQDERRKRTKKEQTDKYVVRRRIDMYREESLEGGDGFRMKGGGGTRCRAGGSWEA